MFRFLKRNPIDDKKKQIAKLYEKAVHFQRNGKLREYAEIIAQIETLQKEVDELQSLNP